MLLRIYDVQIHYKIIYFVIHIAIIFIFYNNLSITYHLLSGVYLLIWLGGFVSDILFFIFY